MIRSVKMQHWRSHADSQLEFSRGTNVLIGPMGSGKSSVMDSICFGLFGTFPALSSRRVSLEETLMQKPTPKDTASIHLIFDQNDDTYTIERTINKTKSNHAKLYKNGSLIAGPKQSEVTGEIEKLLQIDYDLFSRAVYSEQNQIDYFLRMTPKERKEKFDELLQIHKYEQARQNAVQICNRIKKTTTDQKRFLTEQKMRFSTDRIQEIEQKIDSKKKDLDAIAGEYEQLEQKTKQSQETLEKLEQNQRKHRELSDKALSYAAQFKTLETESSRLKQLASDQPPQTIEIEKEKTEQIQQQLQHDETVIASEIKAMQNQLLACTENIGSYKALEKRETDALVKILAINGDCPTCRKPLEEHDKEKISNEMAQLKQGLAQKIESEQRQQQNAKTVLGQLEQRKNETIAEQKKNAEKINHYKRVLQDHQRLFELEQKQEQVRQQLEEAKILLNHHAFDEQQLKNASEEYTHLKNRKKTLENEITSKTEFILEMQRQLKELAGLRTQIEDLEKQVQHNEQIVEKIQLFINCLSDTQTQLREHLIDAINEAMHDIWKRVYPYHDYETCRMVIDEGNYDLCVKTKNGEWMRVEGMLSGGERSAAAICIRLAFALVLTQNLGWIILDEPTHNLDHAGVSELSRMLKNHLPCLVDQIFVITHDKEMEKAATATLYRIDRDKDNDGVSKPEKIEIAMETN